MHTYVWKLWSFKENHISISNPPPDYIKQYNIGMSDHGRAFLITEKVILRDFSLSGLFFPSLGPFILMYQLGMRAKNTISPASPTMQLHNFFYTVTVV